MSMQAYNEDPLAEQPAIGVLSAPDGKLVSAVGIWTETVTSGDRFELHSKYGALIHA